MNGRKRDLKYGNEENELRSKYIKNWNRMSGRLLSYSEPAVMRYSCQPARDSQASTTRCRSTSETEVRPQGTSCEANLDADTLDWIEKTIFAQSQKYFLQ